MKWQQLITDVYQRIAQGLERALDGVSQEDLNKLPIPDCNSMGWLAWHLTRGQDRAIAELMGEEQLWIKDGWHARFNRAADPAETGFGHSSEDVAAFKSPDAGTLLGYHRAVLERSQSYLGGLAETDLDRELGNPVFPTVAARLVGVISDDLQHVGQVAYVRGLLKGKGWSSV